MTPPRRAPCRTGRPMAELVVLPAAGYTQCATCAPFIKWITLPQLRLQRRPQTTDSPQGAAWGVGSAVRPPGVRSKVARSSPCPIL